MLQVSDLSVAFLENDQWLMAVENLSFTIAPGQTLVLMGESGCGKSLTAHALMRLLPANAFYGTSSTIQFENNEILNLPEKWMQQFRGKKIGIIFQDPMTALNPVLTIKEQLKESITDHHSLSDKDLNERLIALLHEVEIHDPLQKLYAYPHQLSGGQRQRIVIAMAIANHPDILIADEPTTALDILVQTQIIKLLQSLLQKYRMGLLLITHDLNIVYKIADWVVVMYAGQIIETLPVKDLQFRSMHPYVAQLIKSIPNFDKRDEQLQVVAGRVPPLGAWPKGCHFEPRCPYVLPTCKEIMPPLIAIEEQHQVRCHLYPQYSALPYRESSSVSWPEISTKEEVLVHVENVSIFLGGHQIVDQLSFQLKKRQILALVGESGSGKTTVCRAIMKLIPYQKGNIFYQENELAEMHTRLLKDFRSKVQIIFQDSFSAMNPRMTIEEILAEGMLAQRIPKQTIHKKILTLLDQVGLSATSLTKYPHHFSGGQRQRLCIARALAVEPQILICDEPTSALDLSVQAQILNLLKMLQCEHGLTYLLVTHNMAVVAYLADEVIVMRGGKKIEQAPTGSLLQRPQHEYTKALVDAAK